MMNVRSMIVKYWFFCLFFYGGSCFSAIFASLNEIQKYAEKLNEYPDADDIEQLTDLLAPSYASFHKKHLPGFFSRFLRRIGLTHPLWTAEGFKDLLIKVTQERHRLKGRFIRKMQPSSQDRFFMWGSLHGAFHSFIRDLQELKKNGIINDSLKIMSNNHYFVFIGNVIDRSPFILETLTLVLRIMEKNPGQVFYIKGNHERNERWPGLGLGDELKIRAAHVSDQDIPLKKEVSNFFETLPLALYLVSENGAQVNFVQISGYGNGLKELNAEELRHFFVEKERTLHYLDQSEAAPINDEVNIKALITIKQWSHAAIVRESWGWGACQYGGLQLLGASDNVVKWAVISSPTNTCRRLFNFQYDSFVELKTTGVIDDWRIAVYNRDIREKDAVFKERIFNLIPAGNFSSDGKVEKKSKELKKLSLGTTLDLSGVYKREGARLKDGMLLAIEEINEKGGVNGRFFDLTILDNSYEGTKALKNVNKLLEQGIDIILISFGSPVLKGYLDLVKQKKVASIFPITGEMFARNPKLKYILNFIPPYMAEGALLADYSIEKLKRKSIVFYYNPQATGDIQAARRKLEPVGFEIKAIPYVSDDDVDKEKLIKGVVNEIKRQDPSAIMFTCPTSAARELIEKMGLTWIKDVTLMGMSDFSEISFLNYIKSRGLDFTYTSFLPDVKQSKLQAVQEFRAAADEKGLPLSLEIFYGYLFTKLFAYMVGNVKGDITKEVIIEVGERIKNFDFKGFILNFDSNLRQLSHTLWLEGNGKRTKYNVQIRGEDVVTSKMDDKAVDSY